MVWTTLSAAYHWLVSLNPWAIVMFAVGWAFKAWLGVIGLRWLRLRWQDWKESRDGRA